MKVGKHCFVFRRWRWHCCFGKRRLNFTASVPYAWDAFVNGESICRTYERTWYLDLWWWTFVLDYWRREPKRINGVPL